MRVRNHNCSSVRLLCHYTLFFSVLVLEYCGVCFFFNIILCISVITVYQRTPDIAICEVETVSKDAIPGQYFPRFLSHFEVFN